MLHRKSGLKVRLPWFCSRALGACRGTLAALIFGSVPASALEGMRGIHDPSTMMECDGKYYVYGTGRGVSVLTSADRFTWERGTKVFEAVPESVRAYVPKHNGQGVWAPDIIKVNGEYYLYYSISVWGQFVSAVGLMTSPTLDPTKPDYKWTDRGMVVHSSEGEDLNAIDPGVCLAPDGRLWICYGSYHGNIELVELNPKTGLRLASDSPVSIIADHSEAAVIIFREGYYYLLVNHGSCCAGAKSTYNIRVGRSLKPTGPYLDRHGDDLAKGAGTLFLAAAGKQIGPGHFGLIQEDGVEKFSCHYEVDLEIGGRSVLDIRPLLWTADGWPMPGNDVREGTYQIRSQRTGTVLQSPSKSGDSKVQTARYLVHDDQTWKVTPAGGGFYKIASSAGANLLQAAEAGPQVAPATGAENELWKIDQLSDGTYRIVPKAGKLALSATAKVDPGNGVALQAFTGDDAQRWLLTAP